MRHQIPGPERYRLGIWMTGSFLICAVPSVWLLLTYRQPAFDLGIYDQSVWLLAHGETINTIGLNHVFGAHFSPVLYLLTPLAWVPGGAAPELVFEALAVASGVYPVWRLARLAGRNPHPYLLIYAIHPGLFAGAWFGFRPWNLAAPFLMWSALWIWRHPSVPVIVGIGMAGLLLREDIAIWVMILCTALSIMKRVDWRVWAFSGFLLAIPTLFVLRVVLPLLSPGDSYIFSEAFALEDTVTDPATGFATSIARILYLSIPLGVGVAAFRIPAFLPLLPALGGLALLGGNALLPGLHYEMPFVVVLVVGLLSRAAPLPNPRLVIVGALVATVLLGPLRPFGTATAPSPLRDQTDGDRLHAVSDLVAEASTQNTSMVLPTQLAPHFSERKLIFLLPFREHIQRGKYEWDCPSPSLVVRDTAYQVEPDEWDHASAGYDTAYDDGRYSVHILREPSLVACNRVIHDASPSAADSPG